MINYQSLGVNAMTDCTVCGNIAETKETHGVIYVRVLVTWFELKKWCNVPVCRKCFDKHGGRKD